MSDFALPNYDAWKQNAPEPVEYADNDHCLCRHTYALHREDKGVPYCAYGWCECQFFEYDAEWGYDPDRKRDEDEDR